MEATNFSILIAFAAGSAAFFSPCILPLIPAYLSYLTGISFYEESGTLSKEKKQEIRQRSVVHSLAFIAGFTIVFTVLGMTVTLLGSALSEYQDLIKKVGGIVIIFFALVVLGIIKVPLLQKGKQFAYQKNGISIIGSILVGATFAIAWTPCVGPILGSILVYASTAATVKTGFKLLVAFSLGLGVPFFLSAVLVNSFLAHIKKITKYLGIIKKLTGILLLIFGILLLTGIRV